MKDRLKNIPVPILPTMVGAITLSNVYNGMGYSWIRNITMLAGTVVLICYLGKILLNKDVFLKEYSQTVPASLYAGFTMILMLLGSYYVDMNYTLGKGLWVLGLGIHIIHILIFLYRNVIKERDINTFLPSWFVTFNGIMVSAVIGGAMNEPVVTKIITYYGIGIYFIILPFMLYRLITVKVEKPVYHTQAILLAPCSLCLVSYLNTVEDPNITLFYILMVAVLASLGFIIIKLPRFFALKFTPAYAGLTFPMAIGLVATTQGVNFLESIGNIGLANLVSQIRGIQLYLTTFIIGYVLIKFIIMLLGTEEKMEELFP